MRMGKPEISVIVPALNEEKHITACLRSIAGQETRRDFEIIVSDGGSGDRTVERAEKLADRIVHSRKGIANGRNAGARAARGEILVFVDSDSSVPGNYIDSIVPILRDRRISGASCGFEFDRKGGKLKIIEDVCNRYLVLRGIEGKGELLGFNNAMRLKDFRKAGGFPLVPLEDHAMARRLWKIGRVVFLPEPKAVTSSRRIEEQGILNTSLYYANLTLASSMPDLKLHKLLDGINIKYVPVR
jgi:glycosyltransferase involved in cell wall biosynthesis